MRGLKGRAGRFNSMSMLRAFASACALLAVPLSAQPDRGAALNGAVEGKYYVSPTGAFKVEIPVLPELGGTITDTENVVTFQDDFNIHISIAAFPQDAAQRWELSTRGLKDYLGFFFNSFVLPDFQQVFEGTHIQSAAFLPSVMGGTLICYTLLPGGSMFGHKLGLLADPGKPPVAKRGNLLFVRNHFVFVISMELVERVTEGSTYHKSTPEEDALLKQRLTDLVSKMVVAKNSER